MNQSPASSSIQAQEGRLLRWLPWIAGALALGLIIGYATVFRSLPLNERPDAWGQFGDYMGGLLNPLISLFTLIVAVSVWNCFSGKRAFRFLTSAAGPFPDVLIDLFPPQTSLNTPSHSIENVRKAWDEHSPMLDHYFRVIFTLLREAKPLLQNDRYRYIKILRAQLSRDEVNLMTMNLLFDEEGERMRELVADYGFLKHLPRNNLRVIAEQELHPRSFGQKWAINHLLAPSQAAPC